VSWNNLNMNELSSQEFYLSTRYILFLAHITSEKNMRVKVPENIKLLKEKMRTLMKIQEERILFDDYDIFVFWIIAISSHRLPWFPDLGIRSILHSIECVIEGCCHEKNIEYTRQMYSWIFSRIQLLIDCQGSQDKVIYLLILKTHVAIEIQCLMELCSREIRTHQIVLENYYEKPHLVRK